MTQSSIGVIGLAVMGANLARNFASRGFQTSVYNRSYEKTQELVEHHPNNLVGTKTLEEFVDSIASPRIIIMMVKSGQPVDDLIAELKTIINPEDILVDCGNSNWKDTGRRQMDLFQICNYVGCGVSGGSLGALYGPSIMPGGERDVVDKLIPFLMPASAKDFGGKPCVTHIGAGASGHFVKMVHNGIEYGLMQGIAEIYNILRNMGMKHEQMREVFGRLNHGNLQSYLLDITEDILESKSPDGKHLLELVDDKAGSKGTGGWTVESGIEYGVDVSVLSAALFARFASSSLRFPHEISNPQPYDEDQFDDALIEVLHQTLELVFFACYNQGIELIQTASGENDWGVSVDETLRIWEGGCIIRSQMISTLRTYLRFGELEKIEYIHLHIDRISRLVRKLAHVTAPKPVISASIDYILTLTSLHLPTNLIQAQRDYFGEHTYLRTDTGLVTTGGWTKN